MTLSTFDTRNIAKKPTQQQVRKMSETRLIGGGVFIENDRIPAGYTYLAQLFVHDLTGLSGQVRLENNEDGKLNLSSIFGGGPKKNPDIYTPDGRFAWHPEFEGAPADPQLSRWEHPRLRPRVDPNATVKNENAFLISDARNNDNVVLLQIRNMFCHYYNRVFQDLKPARLSLQDRYGTARDVVETTFRSIIRNDLCGRLLHPDFADRVATLDAKFLARARAVLTEETGGFREFNFAVGRIGHSMVRSHYDVSCVPEEKQPNDKSIYPMVVAGKYPDNRIGVWRVDWTALFDLDDYSTTPGNKRPLLGSRRIGPFATNFFREPTPNTVDSTGKDLADTQIISADLLRSFDNLRSGQQLARDIGQDWVGKPLSGDDLHLDDALADTIANKHSQGHYREKIDQFNHLLSARKDWRSDTPLVLYVLIEAYKLHQGLHLGPLGSFVFGAAALSGLQAGKSDISIETMPAFFDLMYPGNVRVVQDANPVMDVIHEVKPGVQLA